MRRSQRGFTLLEILIAVLVLAIGLLGFAALQMGGLAGAQDNAMRAQALTVAGDLADRLRANREYLAIDRRVTALANLSASAWDAQDGNLYTPAPGANQTWATLGRSTDGADCATAAACPSTGCSLRQMAARDVYESCLLAKERLAGRGLIETQCNDSTNLPARRNPYSGGTYGTHPWRQPALLAAGNDNDACSPGSRISIRVSWPRQIHRNAGERGPADSVALAGCPAGRDCVILEVQP